MALGYVQKNLSASCENRDPQRRSELGEYSPNKPSAAKTHVFHDTWPCKQCTKVPFIMQLSRIAVRLSSMAPQHTQIWYLPLRLIAIDISRDTVRT